MAIDLKFEQLPTPQLEFGSPGYFTDPKLGLTSAGPFDLRFGAAHTTSIRIGLVGPSQMIANANRWFERCMHQLPPAKKSHPQYPGYAGFSEIFRANLVLDSRWTIDLDEEDKSLMTALEEQTDYDKFKAVLQCYTDAIGKLANRESDRKSTRLNSSH